MANKIPKTKRRISKVHITIIHSFKIILNSILSFRIIIIWITFFFGKKKVSDSKNGDETTAVNTSGEGR